MYSETHCHVDAKGGDAIARAKRMGVELILTAGIDLISSEEAIQTSRRYEPVKACVGIHPWNADLYGDEARRKLEELAEHSEVVAVSEIGLDYVGRRTREGKFVSEVIDEDVQRAAFRGQLRLAVQMDLPAIVHDRARDQEILDIVEEEGNIRTGVIIHGFAKDYDYAKRCVEKGICLSIGSRPLSAQGNESLIEAIKKTPLEYLVTETDSENPEGVLTVAERIAGLKGTTKETVGAITTRNLRRVIE